MLDIWAEEVFTIGTVAGVLQPVVVNAKLRNVPEEGIYNWDPGAFFGIYKPDGFWFDMSEVRAKSASLGAAWPIRLHPRGVAGSAQISVGD
jgi:peptide/nickel transport system substrate-binding protein